MSSDAADVLLQAQQVADDAEECRPASASAWSTEHLGVELDVELEAADAREVVLLGVEEHAVEEVRPSRSVGGSPGRRRR